MRILVTGREGQVARAIAERVKGHRLDFAARPELDLVDASSIERAISVMRPDLIISAAAYTNVDRAEDEPDQAMLINGNAPAIIGRAARKIDARVLHLSTDYVFDGALDRPWREDDPVAPQGAYGRSKLVGERALAESGATYAIIRTAWVYSPFGHNFVKTMIRLAAERAELTVVDDQFGCPTSAFDIADALAAIIDVWQSGDEKAANRIYHFAGTGDASWAQFAAAVMAGSRQKGGPFADIVGIPTSDYPTKAKRPANSRLDCSRFAEIFGHRAPHWQASLPPVIDRVLDPTKY